MMRQRLSAPKWLALVTLFLTACGGGEGTFFADTEQVQPGDLGIPVPETLAKLTIVPDSLVLSTTAELPNDPGNAGQGGPEGSVGVTLSVLAFDERNNALANVPVFVTASSGLLVPDAGSLQTDPVTGQQVPVTNAFGQVRFSLTTGGDATERVIAISAQAGDIVANFGEAKGGDSPCEPGQGICVVEIQPDEPANDVVNLQLSADSTSLLADAAATEQGISLTAVATDAQGNVVPDVAVSFRLAQLDSNNPAPTPLGALQVTQPTTGADGTATAVLTTGNNPVQRTFQVIASVDDNAAVALAQSTITVVGNLARQVAVLDLFSTANRVVNSGAQPLTVTAIAKDANNNVVPGAPISFRAVSESDESGAGALSPGGIVLTDNSGVATVQFTAGGLPIDSVVSISAVALGAGSNNNNVASTPGTISVTVVNDPNIPVQRDPTQVALAAQAEQLFDNAVTPGSGVQLIAVVTDDAGLTVPDVPVTFTLSPQAQATITLNDTLTNNQGIVTAQLRANANSVAGNTLTVTASIGVNADQQQSSQVQVQVVPGRFVLELLPSPQELAVGGSDSLSLRANVFDNEGRPINGIDVNVSTNLGRLSRSTVASGSSFTINDIPVDQAGQVTVTANIADGPALTVNVPIVAQAQNLQIALSETTLTEGDLNGSVTVEALVSDQFGGPVDGVLVDFQLSGPGILQVQNSNTQGGVATANIRLAPEATAGATITVSVRTNQTGARTQSIRVLDDGEPVPQEPASVRLILSAPTLGTGADTTPEGLTVTAIVTDQNANAIEGQQVTFRLGSLNGSLQVTRGATDAAGSAQAVLTTGGDPTERSISLTAEAAGVTATRTIPVAGTALALSGPTSIGLGNVASYDVALVDSSGSGIPNQTISITADANLAPTVTSVVTDSQGTARFDVQGANGTTANQTDSLTISALNGTETDTLEVTVSQFALSIVSPAAGTEVALGSLLPVVALLEGGAAAARQLSFSATRGSLTAFNGQSASSVTTTTEDLDGDGNFDTGEDANGNGQLDAGEDIDGDNVLDLTEDLDGDGVFDAGEDLDGDGRFDLVNEDLDGDNRFDQVSEDANANGVLDAGEDADGDGRFEVPRFATVQIQSQGAGGAGPSLISVAGPEGSSSSVSIEFIAQVASRVDIQVDPGTVTINNSANVTATVRDAVGNLVKNQIVEFRIDDQTGGQLSAPTAITNSQGKASVTYAATGTPSANRGVVVRAFTAGNFAAGTPCNDVDGDGDDDENSDGNGTGADANLLCDQFGLTVGGQALRVSLGTGNTLAEPTTTTYAMPWSVIVTDAAGNPAPTGTSLRLRLNPISYQKGTSVFIDPAWERIYTVPTGVIDFTTLTNNDFSYEPACDSEDLDENGVLSPGEDLNGDGILTPSNVASVPADLPLDENGAAFFDITYAQQFAEWVKVELIAIATVAGTETQERQVFLLPGIASDFTDDEVPPPGADSPYGLSGSCLDAN